MPPAANNRVRWGLDVGTYGALATPENILALARLAEDSEFDSIWLADHIVFPVHFRSKYPYSESGAFPVPVDEPVMEPLATMGVLIGATQRLHIGTAVLVMPYRNPVMLGKMFATLDQFSGGRVILGAGVGWLEEEFNAVASLPFSERGVVTDEYLEIFKRVSGGGEVSFEGSQYQLKPVYAYPGSVQRPHPKVVIGGTSSRALRRVVRLGDGWMSVALGADQLSVKLDRMRDLCDEHGRNFDTLSLTHKLFIDLGGARSGVAGKREPGTGTTSEIIDDLKQIVDLGYTEFIVRYRGGELESQTVQLRKFVDEIIPRI